MTDADSYDVIILGAGISGMVAASVMAEDRGQRVLLLDEYPQVGGNHLDFSIDGYTFDVGSLIFQDDSPLVRRFPELMEHYVHVRPTWARLSPQGAVGVYPFSLREDIIAPGPLAWLKIGASLVWSRLRYRDQRNARDFACFWVGRHFARDSGLESYMERFCGLPADRIDIDFARARMMWIAEHARVGTQLRHLMRRRRSAAPVARNRQLARPREGFAPLYGEIVDRLVAAGVDIRLGTATRSIERAGADLVVSGDGHAYRAPRVISTIPIHLALGMIGREREPLPTVTLVTLFYSFAGERGFTDPILYNFSHDGAWKRLTVYSDFYGPHREREFFAVEVVANDTVHDVEVAHAGFLEHVRRNGLFDGDLKLEGGTVLSEVYPIFTLGSSARSRELKAELREFGVESIGKQGGFEYQPTARVSTLNAERSLAEPPVEESRT